MANFINCLHENDFKCNKKRKIFGIFKQTCTLHPFDIKYCEIKDPILDEDSFDETPSMPKTVPSGFGLEGIKRTPSPHFGPPNPRPNPIPFKKFSVMATDHSGEGFIKTTDDHLQDINLLLATILSEIRNIKKEINQEFTNPLPEELLFQINNCPNPLKSYIHSLSIGPSADLILENEQLRQENQEMKLIIENFNTQKYFNKKED